MSIDFQTKNKPALVLGGGGIKAAAFHLGVCLALEEKGFIFAGGSPEEIATKFPSNEMTFKTYVGSSGGASIAAFLASGHRVHNIIDSFAKGSFNTSANFKRNDSDEVNNFPSVKLRDLLKANIDSRSLYRLVKGVFRKGPSLEGGREVLFKRGLKMSGLFKATGIEGFLRKQVFKERNHFDALGVELYVIATELNEANKYVFNKTEKNIENETIKYANYASISEAVAASGAMPLFFAPYSITNKDGKSIYFFDGEIRDTLSTHVATDNGADLVVASYTIQPYHYNEQFGSLHEYGFPVMGIQAIYQLMEQKINYHIRSRGEIRKIIGSVESYLKKLGVEKQEIHRFLTEVTKKIDYRPDVDYIYIHPAPNDYHMFFADHMSLKPAIIEKIVKTGFRAAMNKLRAYSLEP